MRNGKKAVNVYERIIKLLSAILKMVVDGVRDPHKVAEALQRIAEDAKPVATAVNIYEQILQFLSAILKMVEDGGDPHKVAEALQRIAEDAKPVATAPIALSISPMKEEYSSEMERAWRFPAVTSEASPEKFVELFDLGIITVPWLYSLSDFKKRKGRFFHSYDDTIVDTNSITLFVGRKFHARIFEQNVEGETTSEERLAFLAAKNAVLLGAVGIALVWEHEEQKRKQLPRGYCHTSFSSFEKENVPGLDVFQHGVYNFTLVDFEVRLTGFHTLLLFEEVRS
jgi:hypothetical protein